VLIEPTTNAPEAIGIDKSQWSDDPESLVDWGAWIRIVAESGARIIELYDSWGKKEKADYWRARLYPPEAETRP
jgi:hypothetical protein